jgi:hypothetical protein
VAITLGCTTNGIKPVPVGMHTAVPVCSNTGAPPAKTRTAATTHWAVTQGGLVVPVRAQPVIA